MLPLPPPKFANAAPLDNAISLVLTVIPVPAPIFNVASPVVAPPVNPLPATTEVISPPPTPKPYASILSAIAAEVINSVSTSLKSLPES